MPAGPWIARSSSPDDRGPAGTDMLLQKRIFLQPNVVKESSRRDPIPVNRDDLIFVKMEKQMPEVQEPPKPVQTLKVQTQNLDSNLHEELRALISSGNKNGAIAFIFSKLQYWKYTKRVPRPVKEMKWSTSNPHPKGFITFEPDAGGFNNIRMNFETVLAFALILNRTLVIPPTQQMYLLHKPSGLGDYFDLADLKAALPAGLLTTEEYLKLRNVSIQYGERRYEDLKELLDFLRKQGPTPKWNMHSQALAVPSIKECNLTSDIGRMPYSKEFGRPYPTLQEFMAYRKDVVEFSSMDLEAEVIHFRTDKHSNEGYRLFGNYHTFLYFSDPEWFRYTAAFIRYHTLFSVFLFYSTLILFQFFCLLLLETTCIIQKSYWNTQPG